MHSEILSDRQQDLLSLMAQFRREYYLVGGTAIALYIGHRRPIQVLCHQPQTELGPHRSYTVQAYCYKACHGANESYRK